MSTNRNDTNRLEICRDRRDRRSCKIFPSCVNFSRKQRGSLSNLHRNMKFTQLFGDFTHISFKTIEIMHIHFNFNKRDYQCSHKRCFIVAKKVALYALLVCKIFGPKIRLCKFFWQISSLIVTAIMSIMLVLVGKELILFQLQVSKPSPETGSVCSGNDRHYIQKSSEIVSWYKSYIGGHKPLCSAIYVCVIVFLNP